MKHPNTKWLGREAIGTKINGREVVALYFGRPVFKPAIPIPPVRRADGKLVDALTGKEIA